MAVFSILCALATALAALTVLAAARRGADEGAGSGPGSSEAGSTDAAARELDELDRLKARGLLAEDAWAAARAEAGRRLLTTTSAPAVLKIGRRDRLWVLGGLVLTGVAVLTLYGVFGKPGMADEAYATRVEDWSESTEPLEPAQVAAVLSREADLRPQEPQILTMLGAARFQAGDAIGAASAFRRALARGDVAGARVVWAPLMAALEPADPRRAELEQRLGTGR